MALSKVWYTSANRAQDDVSTTARVASSILFALKGFLMGHLTGTAGPDGQPPASSNWTLTLSSDGVTASAADNLGAGTYTAGKWVRAPAGVAHSWYVLKSPTTMLDQPWFLLVDWGTASDQTVNMYISKNAFTGGTITARPTAVNESAFLAVTFAEATAAAGKCHFTTDANGSFWFAASRNGTGLAQWAVTMQELVDTRSSGDVARAVLLVHNLNTSPGAPDLASGSPTWRGHISDGTTGVGSSGGKLLTCTLGGSTWAASILAANPMDGKVDELPIAYIFDLTSAHVGLRGRLPDVWYVGNAVANGSVEPSVGTVERVKLGSCVLPFSVSLSL